MPIICPYCGSEQENNQTPEPGGEPMVCKVCGQELTAQEPSGSPRPVASQPENTPQPKVSRKPKKAASWRPPPRGETPLSAKVAPQKEQPMRSEYKGIPGVAPQTAQAGTLPYLPLLEVKDSGRFLLTRFWLTIWQVLIFPHRVFENPSPRGVLPSFIFAMVMSLFYSAGLLIFMMYTGITDMILGEAGVETWMLVVATYVYLIPFIFGLMLVIHVILMIFRRDKAGFAATFRVVCYSMAAAVLCLIPLIGLTAFFVWGLVVMIIGCVKAHSPAR